MEPTAAQLAELARQLAGTAPNEIDCEAVLDCVAAYFEATQSGITPSADLAMVGQHLEVCPSCLEEFQALVRASAGE